MNRSTRYGIVAIGALALLSFVHWLRDRPTHLGPVNAYLIGVAPNFAAAIAINFVLLSIWLDQNRANSFASVQNRFFVCAAISGTGLTCWELFQKNSRKLVFDPHDLFATAVGLGTAFLLFRILTPRPID